MEKVIWVISNERKEMIDAQRRINSTGSMRAFCVLSFAALERAVSLLADEDSARVSSPSLFVIDYDMSVKENFKSFSYLKQQPAFAGVPTFFMAAVRNEAIDEECYVKGATVVLHKPFSNSGILRMERTAWQYEVTKNYEQLIKQQAGDLQEAREREQLYKQLEVLNGQLESRNQLLSQIFGRYFSDDVVDVILEDPKGASIGGEKRKVTAMIADLRGFTAISEGLSPEALTDLLNHFYDEMMTAISSYHGTVIEFLGDAILAVFGAPMKSENQVSDAICAAITMQNAMLTVNQYCERKGYPTLEMGIGLAQGDAFVGNIGSEKMMRYNVLGSVINTCSRIESYSVGGQILIAKELLGELKDTVIVKNTFSVHAKGVKNLIKVCEITGISGEKNLRLLEDEEEKMISLKHSRSVRLQKIKGKVVAEKCYPASVLALSKKQMKVMLKTDEEALALYGDVALSVYDQDEQVCSDVYGKVIEVDDNRLLIHFTFVNQDLVELYKQVKRERDNI